MTLIAWLLLALLHLPPAAAAVSRGLVARLYGIAADGDAALLLQHRAFLFAAVASVCVTAAFVPGARGAAALVTAISMIGFLIVYAAAGFPQGALRSIAIADAIGLPVLAFAVWRIFAEGPA
jgi:hypothetical protein